MKKKLLIFLRPTAFHLKLLEFQTDSLFLEIQTKPTIQLISIHMLFVRNMCVFRYKTGNPELDFLNELYTTALRDGVSPYSLQVENGSFVIPHGDHNHYIKVQTKGYEWL